MELKCIIQFSADTENKDIAYLEISKALMESSCVGAFVITDITPLEIGTHKAFPV